MQLLRYNSPTFQVALVGLVCFCTVGMFQAVSNLGAGGSEDITLTDTANAVLYGMFAIMSIVAGSINNVIGPKWTMFLGTTGYGLYVGSLWCFQVQGTQWFVIFAGAVLGVSAALLWAAQGAIMMSYPLEKDKGRSFSLFWIIFMMGSFIGGIIAMAINLNKGGLSAVATSTYIAFIVIIIFGMLCSFTLLPPSRIVRSDGTLVKLQPSNPVRVEISNLWASMKDWRLLLLIPMFFGSNYFYAYQGAFSFELFDSSTRAVTAVISAVAQITGAAFIGPLLDSLPFHRRTRGFIGLGLVSCIIIGAWGGGLSYQLTFTRADGPQHISYKDSRYGRPAALIFFWYFGDAMYQALAYWVMGAMSNDPFTLARYAGFYKGLQSAGSAVSFGVDAGAAPYLREHLSSWLMLLVSLPLVGIVLTTVVDTNYDKEGVVYENEVVQTDHGLEKVGDLHKDAEKAPSDSVSVKEAEV